ncbi:hypothetical protein ES703_12955 [subsurface metagenome]
MTVTRHIKPILEVVHQLIVEKVDWKFRRKHLSDGTTPLDIKSGEVRRGWKRTVQRVSVEDETTGCTEIRIGYINDHGVISWYSEQWTPQAGVLYWVKDTVVLQVGYSLLVRFIGSRDGDTLGVYAYGYEEEVEQ